MSAPRIDLEITQGESWSKSFTVIGDDGLPVAFTSATAAMQVRESAGGTLLVTLTTANSRISLGATDGSVVLSLPAGVTTDLAPAGWDAVYDLEITLSDSRVLKPARGKIIVTPEVTV